MMQQHSGRAVNAKTYLPIATRSSVNLRPCKKACRAAGRNAICHARRAPHEAATAPLSAPGCARVRRCVVRAEAHTEKQTPKKIPVTVITGFLGSGKTTLLNNILRKNDGRRIAVIENEFGAIDIDSELVASSQTLEGTNDSITMLNNGCLCCTVRDDLIKTLNNLWRRRDMYDHIIIETTGLASPAPIISSFYLDPDLPDRVTLDGVVTVVDALNVVRHLDKMGPEAKGTEAIDQIAYADRIVLNKTDLVAGDALADLRGRIQAINSMALVQPTQKSDVSVDFVLGVGGFDLDKVEEQVDLVTKKHHHDHDHGHDHDHDHECSGGDCTHESHQHSHAHHHHHHHTEGEAHTCGPDCDHDHEHHEHQPASKPAVVRHDDEVSSVSFVVEGNMDLDRVNKTMEVLLQLRSEDIYRMKGILSIDGCDQRFVYQGVHMLFEGTPERDWLPGEKRCSKLVFIGKYLDGEAFEEAFKDCVVKEATPVA